jgi:glycosyltransferase involved in cell wall biosynthesis
MSRVMHDRTICLVSHAPFVSGAEIALENLANGLREHDYELTLVLGQRKELWDRLRAQHFHCEYVPMLPPKERTRFGQWNAQRQLRNILRRERPCLVHANDLPSHQFSSAAARGLPTKTICHHRAMFDAPGLAWFNKQGADTHLFVSASHQHELTSLAPNILSQRPVVVHDGTQLSPCPTAEDRNTAKKELGLDVARRMVLFVGQMTAIKGIDHLLQAWSQLPSEFLATSDLVLVGDDLQQGGAYRRQMEQLSKELGTTARFVGYQKNVRHWWTAADIAVVPSLVEPFGLVNVEAMAHGIPVIATNVGGIPEIVLQGETGVLVPPNDPPSLTEALIRLLRQPECCTLLGNAGRKRCEMHFSVAAHVQRVIAVYDELKTLPRLEHRQPATVSA